MQRPILRHHLRRFRRDEDGAALVEFALSLPMILILAYLTIESMRLLWSYQAAIAGVRDATRYLARIAPSDLCVTGDSVDSYTADLLAIVDSTIAGDALFPAGVSVTALTPSVACNATLSLRQASVPVATVAADLSITMPFAEILRVIGGTGAGTIVTTVQDQARVYGL